MPDWPADQPERRALSSLRPFPRNARLHSAEQVAQIVASITEWGWTMPVLIDETGEIIAGHARVLAATELQLAEVPVLVARDWSEAQKRAYVLADNKLSLNASWDDTLLRLELDDLRAGGFELGLTGFAPDELAHVLGIADEAGFPALRDGDRQPFQTMTFTLHDSQAELVKRAMSMAKHGGDFDGTPSENSNGNALERICREYIEHHDRDG